MEAQAQNMPTRAEIVPPKTSTKRNRDESVPQLNFTPPPNKVLMKPNIITHDEGEDVFIVSDNNIAN